MKDIDLIALQTASQAFGNRIPDHWNDLTDADQGEWLYNNRMEAFEDILQDQYYSLIDCHADSIKLAIKKSLNILKDKLIDAAIEGELPSDFNELDLTGLLGMDESC